MQGSKTKEKKLAGIVIERLIGEYGIPVCTLDDKEDPWRLLVAAVLAAQCTDERVNKVTPALFARYPRMEDFALSSQTEIEPYIQSCGLFRNKAKSIYLASRYLLDEEEGQVPQTLEALLKVPGVGRKIANLILGECFGQEALVVDTHCGRLARRLGFTEKTDAGQIEKDLAAVVPKEHWTDWGHLMVTHGREVCQARSPQCSRCVLADVCEEGKKNLGIVSSSGSEKK